MEQGKNENWHRMMELAESNHMAAVFFLGWLSQPVPEEDIAQGIKIFRDVEEVSKIENPLEALQALIAKFGSSSS
jgi:hypothetical protein